MKKTIADFAHQTGRSVLVYAVTVAISLPILALCLLLTLSSAFWLYDAIQDETLRYVSRRILLLLSLPGCVVTLLVNGFLIYRINHYLEARFK
ncbi:MAG: hypothetical protein DDG60_14280 [Anaerolineae bacterium]|nr:MAG: hypothetical protein DDG60_14280 [Anaerolineae bacterium]